MKLINLTEKEFKKFADKNPLISFHQTNEWGHLKEENGWKMHLLGLMDNDDKIVAGALVLSKRIPFINKNMFYSPRGFLIDYGNYRLLKEFTLKLKDYVKENKGVFVKIDPYLSYRDRDIEGNIVKNGNSNKKSFYNLEKLGYKHFGFNLMQDTLQPRWMFITKTKKRTVEDVMKDMDPKTRQIIRKNERLCIRTREIGYDELDKFKDIMQHTGDRREFIDRPLKYYQDMYKHMDGIVKVLLAELHVKDLIEQLTNEVNGYQNEYDDRKHKHDDGINKMNEDKYNSKQEETKNNIERVKAKLKEVKELKKNHGDVITLGGILFLVYGNEVLSLVGGSYDEFMEYQSAYTVHWAGCKYAIENNYDRYNFYGITGDFSEKNPLVGLYLFKKGFGGEVVELIGEFDLVINKHDYLLYKAAFKTYHGLKNIKSKIKR